MKVIKQKDLFGEIEIHLLSPHLDKSVYGLGPDLESAKVVFEKRVVIAIRLEFKNFVSVFRNSKYNYNPIQHKTTLNLFNGALKRINKRTKLVNAQTRIRRVYDALELALSSRKARSFSSQMAKVNLLGEFIDFDFSSWIPAPENKLQTI